MRNRTLHRCNSTIVIVFILVIPSIVFATADGPDYLDVFDIAPNDKLTIYLKPVDSSLPVGTIPHNTTCLKNLGCKGDDSNWWCKIVYQGTVGWVDGKLVIEGGDCPASFYPDTPAGSIRIYHEIFTQQLLDGKAPAELLPCRDYLARQHS